MTYFVYILYSTTINRYYIGQTNDVNLRFRRHNLGYEKFTKSGIPWKLVFYTFCETRSEAYKLERKLKNFKSQKKLLNWINDIENLVAGAEKL